MRLIVTWIHRLPQPETTSDGDGVTLSDAPIVPNIPNLGNEAFSHNERSLSTSSSDTGATDTIYSGNCAADPGILDDIRQMLLEVWNISEPARARRRLLLTRRRQIK
eukprot:scaffold11749_cov55-Attheya_sp.AAC.4